jgi:Ser/Thr protein kinase RdoA (MazF antagonist)
MLNKILAAYNINQATATVAPFGSGLINNTWLVKNGDHNYILQRINHHIFKQPGLIATNIKNIAGYFASHHTDYFFVTPQTTNNGEEMLYQPGEGYFRLFPFVQKSHTIDVVNTPEQACEAATQFGRFTRLLSNFDINRLQTTLPNFHNLNLRYQQFELALQHGNNQRIKQAAGAIDFLKSQKNIVDTYNHICNNPDFKLRVTHHDTKISNVLFDDQDKGICVIDLDTVMPGYFISDVGDMLRTYLSPVSEEEKDYTKIEIRNEYFKAIASGYLSQMDEELSSAEKNHFVYAGKFLIYMQALRFLTDHLNNDAYYGAKYEGHNFIRTNNQIVLLQKLMDKEAELTRLILQ